MDNRWAVQHQRWEKSKLWNLKGGRSTEQSNAACARTITYRTHRDGMKLLAHRNCTTVGQ
eukprot:208276-Pleurochrysis_carterae.AAC.1